MGMPCGVVITCILVSVILLGHMYYSAKDSLCNTRYHIENKVAKNPMKELKIAAKEALVYGKGH